MDIKTSLAFPADVAFNAQIDDEVQFNAGEKVVFTKVLSNVGNTYNETTGIFTAPYNGTYQFMLMSVVSSGSQYTSITVNGERLSIAYGDNSFGTGEVPFTLKNLYQNKIHLTFTVNFFDIISPVLNLFKTVFTRNNDTKQEAGGWGPGLD